MGNPFPTGSAHLHGPTGMSRCAAPVTYARKSVKVGPFKKEDAEKLLVKISGSVGIGAMVCHEIPGPVAREAEYALGSLATVTTIGGYYSIEYSFPKGCYVIPVHQWDCHLKICDQPLPKAKLYVLYVARLTAVSVAVKGHCRILANQSRPLQTHSFLIWMAMESMRLGGDSSTLIPMDSRRAPVGSGEETGYWFLM